MWRSGMWWSIDSMFFSVVSASYFTWFSLGWDNLENKFHKYFFVGIREMRLTDLTSLSLRNDELVSNLYKGSEISGVNVRIFWTNGKKAELAFQRLLPAIRFSSQEYASLGTHIQRISTNGKLFQEHRKKQYKKVLKMYSYIHPILTKKKVNKWALLNGPEIGIQFSALWLMFLLRNLVLILQRQIKSMIYYYRRDNSSSLQIIQFHRLRNWRKKILQIS